jgi:Domain of unknown function (DUF222)
VPETLLSMVDDFLLALAGFEPRLCSPERCVEVVEVLARVERVCAVARARTAARAAECGAHRGEGFRSPAEWLAHKTGSTAGEAERDLATVSALDGLPCTREALAHGDISLAAAEEIRRTEQHCPGSEQEMVVTAISGDLRATRETGRALRLAAVDPEELKERQHAARSFRHWRDGEGMIRGSFVLPPEVGVPVVHRLDVHTDREFRQAHRAGRVEPREAYAADALVRSLTGESKPHALRADIVYVANVDTGQAHIVGGGPVPMSTVRAAAQGAFVKAVLHDGVRVHTIVHYGRKPPPAHVRTVLELGAPPGFDGVRCADCGSPFRYQ